MSWSHEWLHRVWPSATIARTRSGWWRTSLPTRQNVALTCAWRSRLSTRGVQTGLGPSSKVSATPDDPVVRRVPIGPVRFALVAGRGRAVGLGGGAGRADGLEDGVRGFRHWAVWLTDWVQPTSATRHNVINTLNWRCVTRASPESNHAVHGRVAMLVDVLQGLDQGPSDHCVPSRTT